MRDADELPGARNVRAGLMLLPLGLLMGLGLSLYAFVPLVQPPPQLASYADLPRRLLRLAHIAAVMLPLFNIVLGQWLDGLRLPLAWRRRASAGLLVGAVGLPLALAAEAVVPALARLHPSGVPALALVAAAVVVAVGAWRTGPEALRAVHPLQAGRWARGVAPPPGAGASATQS